MESVQTRNVIDDIYEASYKPEHWSEVLSKIGQLTQSNSAALFYRDNELERASGVFAWNFPSELMTEYDELGQDPHFPLFVQERPLGIATTAKELIPDRVALEEYYGKRFTAYIHKHDMYYIGGVILLNDSTRMVGLGLQRSRVKGPWPPGIMNRVTELSPHIQRALHIHREFTLLRTRETALNAGLDRMVIGIILIDRIFDCIYCNPVAKDIIESCNVLAIRNNQLFATKHKDNSKLQKALQKALQASSRDDVQTHSTSMGLWRSDRPTQLPALITPARDGLHDLNLHGTPAQAVVLINDPDRNQPIVPEALIDTYELTPTEAKIAIAIANGYSLDEIAKSHKTTLNTTRTHLKAVFKKTRVTRQSELVKALLTGPFRVRF